MAYEDLRQQTALLFKNLQDCQKENATLEKTLNLEKEDKCVIINKLKESERITEANLK
jgi:hypothetical protein